ncbi:hypothetical protein MBLNU13_g06470t2 [Cladosporium sp. NU13]
MAAPPPPPQWVLDLNSTSPIKPRSGTFPDPPGFTSTNAVQQPKNAKGGKAVAPRAKPSPEEMETLKLKKAWEVAIAPAKQLPMNAIGMYMSGNSLQMFSIMMVFMLFKAPIQALMNINQTFARFESDGKKQEMLMVKAAFIGCNLLALALGLRDQTGLRGKWQENRWNGRTSSRHEHAQVLLIEDDQMEQNQQIFDSSAQWNNDANHPR